MKTDAELIRETRTDAAAFRELYDRYARQVHGYHLRRTRDPHAAHDLTAETFAQAWLARRRFRDRAGGSAGPRPSGSGGTCSRSPSAAGGSGSRRADRA
jgi:RNA polymerase sigma-70 factor (ECF subfamily)